MILIMVSLSGRSRLFAQCLRYENDFFGVTEDESFVYEIDSKNNIWIVSSRWNKLMKFDGSQLFTYPHPTVTGDSYMDGICIRVGGKDKIWIGVSDGAISFDDKQWNFIQAGLVRDIAFDSKGNIWFATSDGIVKYDGSSKLKYSNSVCDIPNGSVNCIAVDDRDNIWVAVYGSGLTKFDGLKWETFDVGNVKKIVVDNAKQGLWLIGEWNLGFLNTHTFNYTDYNVGNSGLPTSFLSFVAIDAGKNTWIGTLSGDGVIRFNGSQWQAFNENSLKSIPEGWFYYGIDDGKIDGIDNLWVKTKSGLIKFNPACESYEDIKALKPVVEDKGWLEQGWILYEYYINSEKIKLSGKTELILNPNGYYLHRTYDDSNTSTQEIKGTWELITNELRCFILFKPLYGSSEQMKVEVTKSTPPGIGSQLWYLYGNDEFRWKLLW